MDVIGFVAVAGGVLYVLEKCYEAIMSWDWFAGQPKPPAGKMYSKQVS